MTPSVVRGMGDGMVSVDCHYPVAGRQVGEPPFCLTCTVALSSDDLA